MPYKNREDRNSNHKKRYAEDPEYKERFIQQRLDWQRRNPDKVKEKNNRSARKNRDKRAAYTRMWRTLNPGKVEEFNEQRKIRVLSHYGKDGTMQCVWEGCTVCDHDMLSIDHINNDGAKDRKIRRTGNGLYLSLEKDNYPEGFQTLCHNHQWKKEILRRKELRMQRALEKYASLTSLESPIDLNTTNPGTVCKDDNLEMGAA